MNAIFLAISADPLPGFAPLSYGAKERLLLLGALLIVIAALIFWVVVIRKKPRRRKEAHHRRRSLGKAAVDGVSEIKGIIHERRRRHRRERRPRNPTLAETGGLPPPRPVEPASPPPSQTLS